MKVISSNFEGEFPAVQYKIVFSQPQGTPHCILELHLKLPGSDEFGFYDCTAGMIEKEYKHNVRRALIQGEEKWNLELLKFDVPETKAQ